MNIKFNVKQAYFEFDGGKIPLTRLLPYGFIQTFIGKLILETFGEDFYSLSVEEQLEELYKFVYGDKENWSKDIEASFDMLIAYIKAVLAEEEEGKNLSVSDYVPQDFIVRKKGGRRHTTKKMASKVETNVEKKQEELEAKEETAEEAAPEPAAPPSSVSQQEEEKVEESGSFRKTKVEEMLDDINRVVDLDF